MKIVIVGCGKIGKTILEGLVREKHDVIFIDNNPQVVETVSNSYDVMGICGNGIEYDVLKEAGVDKCELFIAVTNADGMNMLACFAAKRIGAKHTVARIRELENNNKSLDFMKKQLDLSLAINPELTTAKALYNLIQLPQALKVETFGSKRFEMIEIPLKSDSPLDGIAIKDLRKKSKGNFLICAVSRDEEVFIPKGDFILKSGDKVGFIVSGHEINSLLDLIELPHKKIKNVIIIGAGITSKYLARLLIKSRISVKIIEKDDEVCQSVCEDLDGATVIHGDGMLQDLLIEEGITSCDAFIALTGKDEENILISYYAMSQSVPRVISKVNRKELSNIAEKMGIDCIVSPRNIIRDTLISYARAIENSRGSQIETLYSLMNGKAEALEFVVKSDFEYLNIPLKEMKFKSDTLIAGIIRGGNAVIPSGDDCFLPDDNVIVIATGHRILDLSEIIGK